LIAISGSHTYVNIQGIHAIAEKAVELIMSFSLAYEKGEIQLVDNQNIYTFPANDLIKSLG
jgi:hypothetical protein